MTEDKQANPPRESEPVHIPRLVADNFGTSMSEARRLVNQGAVGLDDRQILDFDLPREWVAGKTLRVGRRRSVKLPASPDTEEEG